MNASERQHAIRELAALEAELARREGYKFRAYFPETGPFRRELYPGAMEFFWLGSLFPERLLLGGNRVGKTDDAAYEVTCHMTGMYPPWWSGRRFDHPVDVWTAGDTATTTRDIQQNILFGKLPEAPKTGMLPAHLIVHHQPKTSIAGAVETISVKHVSGGTSTIQFKSYDQRRDAFQGTSKHVIWLDEECPEDIYGECLLRTLTVRGLTMVTFTPVEGLTSFVQKWLEDGVMVAQDDAGNTVRLDANAEVFAGVEDDGEDVSPATSVVTDAIIPIAGRKKSVTLIAWDEVPHITEEMRVQMLSSIPPYLRAARTKGIPNLGSGVIYPIPEEEVRVKPFEIPVHWPRGYGMDVGWNWTVAVFGAYDRETGTWYLYKEHYRSHAEPPVHAEGIRAVGKWIPGRIDPAANGRSQNDGKQLLQMYSDLGLQLDFAANGVEAGIHEVWTALAAGRIKVFSSLKHWFTEYRMYRRDAKGRIVKKNDHAMDATRYLVASGPEWLQVVPVPQNRNQPLYDGGSRGQSWMA